MVRYRIYVLALVSVASTLASAGCTRDLNPVRDAFVSVGAGAKVPEAPDFVVASRTSQQEEYIPIGLRPPPRKYRARTEEEIKKVEGQLDAAGTKAGAQGSAVMREGAGQ